MKTYQVLPGLAFCGFPKRPTAGWDAMVTLSKKHPSQSVRMAVEEYRYCPIPDGKRIPIEELEYLEALVLKWLSEGRHVLVHCLAGRDRSVLVAALVYRRKYNCSGAAALAAMRRLRPNCLHNQHFAAWLEALP